jgi:hypothetical protein
VSVLKQETSEYDDDDDDDDDDEFPILAKTNGKNKNEKKLNILDDDIKINEIKLKELNEYYT